MNRAELLTSINSRSEQLDRLLAQTGKSELVGVEEIPDDVALKIIEGCKQANANRNQSSKTNNSSTQPLPGEIATGIEAEFTQALTSLNAIANTLNRMGIVAGVRIGQDLGQSINRGICAGLSAELGKFSTALGEGMLNNHQLTTSLIGVLDELGLPPVHSSLSAIYQSDRNYQPELPPTPKWGNNN